jgi:hypothetical protein
MSAIQSHGEKIAFAGVLLICGAFVAYELLGQGEPEGIAEVKKNQETITLKLKAQDVSPNYEYSTSKAEQKLKVKDAALKNLDRVKADLPKSGQHVFYPVPTRPVADKATEPMRDTDLVTNQVAVLGPLTDLQARGDHGRVFISYKLPQDLKYMDVVRVEIFRGEAEDKIDLKTPYHVAEFASEVAVADIPADTTEVRRTAPVAGPELSTGERKRRELENKGANADDVKPAEPKADEKEEKLEIPEEYKALRLYQDTHVKAKTKYFYKLRVVGRMQMEPGSARDEKDPNTGNLKKRTIYHAPEGVTQVQPKEGSSKQLFATKLSETITAMPPSDYEIRLSGIIGSVSPIGTPEPRMNRDYKGKFAVKVWVIDAQEWKIKEIDVAIGEVLKGTIDYKSQDSGKPMKHEFNSGYVLKEIRQEEEKRTVKEKKKIYDDSGKLVKEEEVERELPAMINEVAYLTDEKGAVEKFPKRRDFEARDKAIKYWRKIAEEQQVKDEANKIRIAELIKKNKERDAQRKLNPPTEPDQVDPMSRVPPPMDMAPQREPEGREGPRGPEGPGRPDMGPRGH